MDILQNTKGYSLVEVLVAIAILLMALVGPMTIASKGIQSASYVREQTVALFLAQEGTEAFTAMRNDAAIAAIVSNPNSAWDWINIGSAFEDCFTDDGIGGNDGCNIDFQTPDPDSSIVSCSSDGAGCELYFDESQNRARYSLDNAGSLSPYTRVIKLENLSPDDGIKVESTVSWNTRLFGGIAQSVTITSVLYNVYE